MSQCYNFGDISVCFSYTEACICDCHYSGRQQSRLQWIVNCYQSELPFTLQGHLYHKIYGASSKISRTSASELNCIIDDEILIWHTPTCTHTQLCTYHVHTMPVHVHAHCITIVFFVHSLCLNTQRRSLATLAIVHACEQLYTVKYSNSMQCARGFCDHHWGISTLVLSLRGLHGLILPRPGLKAQNKTVSYCYIIIILLLCNICNDIFAAKCKDIHVPV